MDTGNYLPRSHSTLKSEHDRGRSRYEISMLNKGNKVLKWYYYGGSNRQVLGYPPSLVSDFDFRKKNILKEAQVQVLCLRWEFS